MTPGGNDAGVCGRVYVYRNLRTGGFSVAAAKGRIGRGKVLACTDSVLLSDVLFVVTASGRERVRRMRQREVHAGAVGSVVVDQCEPSATLGEWVRVTYNPYLHDTFIIRDSGAPIATASLALLTDGHCFVPCGDALIS